MDEVEKELTELDESELEDDANTVVEIEDDDDDTDGSQPEEKQLKPAVDQAPEEQPAEEDPGPLDAETLFANDEPGEPVDEEERDRQVRAGLKKLNDRTAEAVNSLYRHLKKLEQRRQELAKGIRSYEKTIRDEMNERLRETKDDYRYDKDRISTKKREEASRYQSKIDSKKERLRRDAEMKEHFANFKEQADNAMKAREKFENELRSLSPDIRKLHEAEFRRWIEEAKQTEKATEKELQAADDRVLKHIHLQMADYEAGLQSEIMKIEDKARSELTALEKSSADRKHGLEMELDKKINQRQVMLIKDNHILITETMNRMESLAGQVQDLGVKTMLILIKDVMRATNAIERRNFLLQSSGEEEKRKKKMKHYQTLLDIERKELEKKDSTLSRERDRLLGELEERGKALAHKEITLREDLEEDFMQKMEESSKDGLSQTEETLKQECDQRIQDMEREHKKKLLLYKKKLLQYRNQAAAGAPSGARQEPPDNFPCLQCKANVVIPSKKRPVTVRCASCGREYTLRAPKKQAAPPAARPQQQPARPVAAPAAPASGFAELPDMEGPDDEPGRTTVTPPPGSDLSMEDKGDETKIITCPHCSKQHEVPSHYSKKIRCTCGRRIQTK